MYQILQKFDIHWHDGGPSIAMMYHLRGVSDLLCNWKSCLLCYMKDVVLHCLIFFKWNKLVRVRVRERVCSTAKCCDLCTHNYWCVVQMVGYSPLAVKEPVWFGYTQLGQVYSMCFKVTDGLIRFPCDVLDTEMTTKRYSFSHNTKEYILRVRNMTMKST